MDGNYSQLDVDTHLIHCADAQIPLIINIVLGLPANVCVMWLILAGPGDKAAEIFSFNQAACEVSICMANAIALVAMNIKMSDVAYFTCFFYTMRFSAGFLFSGRPLFMGCVCLERYLAVVHPVTFLKYKLLRYRQAGTLISWLTVLVCCVILLWPPYPAIYYVCFAMAFPWFLLQLFCCVETLRGLVRPGPGEGNQESKGMNSAKLRAFRIILIITVASAVTYLPYVVSVILFGHSLKDGSFQMFCITTYISVVTGVIPALLYIHRAGKLQHCFKDTVN